MNRERFAIIVTALAAAFFIGPGLWAFIDPESFYDELATFEPYNEHLIRDIGAFQLGIGAALAAALWKRTDAIFAALAGAVVGGAFHTAAHFIDHDLGGKDSDIFVFGAVTLLCAAAASIRVWRSDYRAGHVNEARFRECEVSPLALQRRRAA